MRHTVDAFMMWSVLHCEYEAVEEADMVYRIKVDGKRKYAESHIREYSLEADNLAREEIVRHFLDDAGAKDVVIESTPEEVRRHCREDI